MKTRTFAAALAGIVMLGLPIAHAREAPAQGAASGAVAAPVAQASAATGVELIIRPEASETGALASFNSYMHGFNLWVWRSIDAGAAWLGGVQASESVRNGVSNVLLNIVNEPTSMLSWAVAGDFDNAAIAARRFWINTTQGWLGVEDVARAQGIVTPPIDIGLALCARGVGEGGYIVLPFVGPRTVRDGLSDFILVNALTYLALTPVIGFPPSIPEIVTVEIAEEAARIALMRQIDHGDDRNPSLSAARDAYLATRRERCGEVTALINSKNTSATKTPASGAVKAAP